MTTPLCTGHPSSQSGNNFIQSVKAHWVIFAALAAGLVAWGTNTANLAHAENEIDKVEARVENVEGAVDDVKDDIGEINNAIIRIDTNQGHIRDDIAEMKRLLQSAVTGAVSTDTPNDESEDGREVDSESD